MTKSRKPIKVLIVDDEPEIREILSIFLKDYEIVEASNGAEAVEAYKKHKPNVVIMDIVMPIMDGITATKKIKEIDPNAKVIALTAFAHSKGKDMLNAGAIELLEKPFTRAKIREIVEKYAKGET
jgi:CheY-like chemotaxis protein